MPTSTSTKRVELKVKFDHEVQTLTKRAAVTTVERTVRTRAMDGSDQLVDTVGQVRISLDQDLDFDYMAKPGRVWLPDGRTFAVWANGRELVISGS